MNYIFKKGLITASLIVIGSDGTVSDYELKLLDNFIRDRGVSIQQEKKILAEINPFLGSAVQKGKLMKEIVQSLTGEEKKEILTYCCKLILSDMKLEKTEDATLKKLGNIMDIPEKIVNAVIQNEMRR